MNGLEEPGAAARRRVRTAAGAAALLAAALLAVALWQARSAAAATFALALAAGLAAAVVASTAAAWIALQHQRLRAELRSARAQAACLGELLDGWHWRTDAAHRLVHCAAATADAPAWHLQPLGMPLWELFDDHAAPAVRARLEAQASLDGLAVAWSPRGAAACTGRLRARVRRDDAGGFAGHEGTLTETPPPQAPAASAGVSSRAGASPSSATSPSPALAALPAPAPEPLAAPPALGLPSGPGELEADHESFSFTVSHDLRAPIRVVEGFTKIVKEDYGRLLDRIGNDHLDRVLGAAARMNSMIDALLALSKLSSQPLARQPVNLTQLASYVTDDLKRQFPERTVVLHIQPGLQVLGDPTLLRVALENLLGNAWKYSAKTREAHIWFERDAQTPNVYTVRDNGAGFDMRFSDRLFGVFQRLHSANDFQGTGVGLASVRRIIRRHGGEIWAEAEVGRGASFHFSLPQ